MINNRLAGKWKGEFVYGPEYGKIEGEKATFMLFVEKEDENGFEGKAFDIEGIGVNDQAASVKGFFADGMMSFIKQYPTTQIFQEDGTLQTFYRPSPEIHYTGEYIQATGMFKGNWETTWGEVRDGDEYLEYLCTGTWQMIRETD